MHCVFPVLLFPCAPVFRIFRVLNYSEYLSLWCLSISSMVSISECSMYLCVSVILLYDVCIVHFCVLCWVYSRVLLCSVISVF